MNRLGGKRSQCCYSYFSEAKLCRNNTLLLVNMMMGIKNRGLDGMPNNKLRLFTHLYCLHGFFNEIFFYDLLFMQLYKKKQRNAA